MTKEEFELILINQSNSKAKAYINLGLIGPALIFVGLSKSNPTKFERKLIMSAGIFTVFQAIVTIRNQQKT